jgi:hypothetical protein
MRVMIITQFLSQKTKACRVTGNSLLVGMDLEADGTAISGLRRAIPMAGMSEVELELLLSLCLLPS